MLDSYFHDRVIHTSFDVYTPKLELEHSRSRVIGFTAHDLVIIF